MSLPGLKATRLAGRWLRSRLLGGAPILGYHRVADPADDLFDLCVGHGHFAEQMAVLRQRARPLPLPELVRSLASGRPPRRAVAVTFDDGYADTLHHALPELERHKVPATVFVVTGRPGGRFWWDELVRLLPDEPRELAEAAALLESLTGGAAVAEVRLSGSRRQVLQAVARRLQGMTAVTRSALLAQLGEAAAPADDAGAGERALTADELSRLAASSLVEIGSHTVAHPALAALPDDAQREEITESKRTLEELLDRPITCFAYPHGSIGRATPGLLREAGFDYACGSASDVASAASDPYRLPRFWIGDWDGDRFARWLDRWLGRSSGARGAA